MSIPWKKIAKRLSMERKQDQKFFTTATKGSRGLVTQLMGILKAHQKKDKMQKEYIHRLERALWNFQYPRNLELLRNKVINGVDIKDPTGNTIKRLDLAHILNVSRTTICHYEKRGLNVSQMIDRTIHRDRLILNRLKMQDIIEERDDIRLAVKPSPDQLSNKFSYRMKMLMLN